MGSVSKFALWVEGQGWPGPCLLACMPASCLTGLGTAVAGGAGLHPLSAAGCLLHLFSSLLGSSRECGGGQKESRGLCQGSRGGGKGAGSATVNSRGRPEWQQALQAILCGGGACRFLPLPLQP